MQDTQEKRRYWVDLGYWQTDTLGGLDPETANREAEVYKKLQSLANSVDESSLTFKTWDEEEAVSVTEEVKRIVEEAGFGSDGIDYRAQPQCSQCGKLLRFSWAACPNCGGAAE